jgi:raffinose/stachyose/melibiose transport system permease protein
MIIYSFKSTQEIFANPFGLPRSLYLQNYIDAVTEYDIVRFFSNSFIVTVSTVFLVVILAATYSYATARMNWKLKKAAYIYLSIGMFIPVQIILLPLLIIVRDLNLANTLPSLIAPYVAFGLPIASILFYSFFRTLPREIEESAAIEGAGIFTIFFRIILPFIRPAIITVIIFTIINTWNEFVLPLYVLGSSSKWPMTLAVYNFFGMFFRDWNLVCADIVLTSLPVVLVYLAGQKYIVSGMTAGAVKG